MERVDEIMQDFFPEHVYYRFNPEGPQYNIFLSDNSQEKIDAMRAATIEWLNQEPVAFRMDQLRGVLTGSETRPMLFHETIPPLAASVNLCSSDGLSGP